MQSLWLRIWHRKTVTSLHAMIKENLISKSKVGQVSFLSLCLLSIPVSSV